MAPKRLIQIVPIRARAPEGVGDYAMRIAEQMLALHGVRTTFIACTPLPPEQRLQDQWETIELERRHPDDLLAALAEAGNAPVLLQLSGYGFHRKALTFWVDKALRRWRAGGADRRVLTVFHELFATGPVWSSPFWLGRAQFLGARRIYRQSGAAIVTTRRNAALLERAEPAGPPLAWMPCFATIGEPSLATTAARQRPARLAVFGRASVLDTVYRRNAGLLEAFVRANGIEEIVDIGARPSPPPQSVADVAVRAMGEMPPEQLIGELSEARFGMLQYEADRLAKSSIFGAFCACGTIPVCISEQPGREDGLIPDGNYLRLAPDSAIPAPPADLLNQLQAAARCWYEPHGIAAVVDFVHQHLLAPR